MTGLYFEEFQVGMIFDHPMHRTITEADNVLFSTMTHNPSPLHLDAEYMKKSQFGQRLVNSCLTLSLMVGISIGDTTLGTTIANLGWDKVRFPKPLFHGDTIRVQTEIIEVRESRSKPDRGIVTFIHRCFNQHDEEVASCLRIAMMMRKPLSEKPSKKKSAEFPDASGNERNRKVRRRRSELEYTCRAQERIEIAKIQWLRGSQ